MSKILRIGTRDSELALWQANTVRRQLEENGHVCELVPIKSKGDLNTTTPLYELGIVGIFTKTLDIALLNGEIDLAVHSFKDVPTLLPKGIVQTAVLERGSYRDILVTKGAVDLNNDCTIATGSIRRKAQWLDRYPNHEVVGLRGNVNTRLQKLADNNWQGAIFAKAGLERIDILPDNHIDLDWMLPAPAQGAMCVVCLETDSEAIEATRALNHELSMITTHVERDFLRVVEGGCTAPIGAHAIIKGNQIHFTGGLFALDGSTKLMVQESGSLNEYKSIGSSSAHRLLAEGGSELMKKIKDGI